MNFSGGTEFFRGNWIFQGELDFSGKTRFFKGDWFFKMGPDFCFSAWELLSP
jgi:hypothetical protein